MILFLAELRRRKNKIAKISLFSLFVQGSTLIIAGTLFALATFYEFQGLGSFCWIYGFGLGSYNYVLKAWTYEKTRAKNFSRAWSFVQCAQGLGCIFGVPATGNRRAKRSSFATNCEDMSETKIYCM